MITCGLCGSGITADEKFKKLKSGGVNRHVYYRCCKSKDRNCKNPALNEGDLIKEFQKLANKLTLDEVKLTEKLEKEIQYFKKLRVMFLGETNNQEIRNVDFRDYMRFVLKEGLLIEKRNILSAVKGNFYISYELLGLY